jgi:hypothetical protein
MPDQDQLYVDETPYVPPRRVLETVSIEWLAIHLARLPTKQEVWRVALLGTLTGAGLVIARIKLLLRGSLVLSTKFIGRSLGCLVGPRPEMLQSKAKQIEEKQITISAWRR